MCILHDTDILFFSCYNIPSSNEPAQTHCRAEPGTRTTDASNSPGWKLRCSFDGIPTKRTRLEAFTGSGKDLWAVADCRIRRVLPVPLIPGRMARSIWLIGGNIMQYDLFSCPFGMLNRMAQVTKLTMKSTRIRIEFTRESWKQFTQLNHSAIPAFVRAINVKTDLALYIVAHEEQNIHLDTECQEVCYRPGLFLIIRKEHGVWYITDVITTGMVAADYAPVFFWTRVKRGCNVLAARVLICWRRLKAGSNATEAGGQFYE